MVQVSSRRNNIATRASNNLDVGAARLAGSVRNELAQQRSQSSVSVKLNSYNVRTGKYEGTTIVGDKVQGDFFGVRAPKIGSTYGFSRQRGAQAGFFTDA